MFYLVGCLEAGGDQNLIINFLWPNIGFEFRLVNGTSSLSGRVEMRIDGEWGTVCGSSKFDDNAADVLCRQLKYTTGRALKNGFFGEGLGRIMVPSLRCKGKEKSLMACQMRIEPKEPLEFEGGRMKYVLQRSNYYTCRTHTQDAAVQCYDKGIYNILFVF